jgi:hypothetical protein
MAGQDDRKDGRVTPFRPRQLISEAEHDLGPLGLSDGELATLRRLAQRLRDDRPGAVNIGHAQRLATLGLAKHDRSGWALTATGLAYLSR